MRAVALLSITAIIDDDVGIYRIGELDFGRSGHCEEFLRKGKNRKRLVEHLRWLADAAEKGTAPFSPLVQGLTQEPVMWKAHKEPEESC